MCQIYTLNETSEKKNSLLLEPQHGVGLQVGNVQLATLGNHLRVLPAQQPADVREEETARRVVRVGVRLRVLVVHAVVPGPVHGAVLERDRVEHRQDNPQRQLGLVRAVGPESVGAGGDTESGHHVQDEGCLEDWKEKKVKI